MKRSLLLGILVLLGIGAALSAWRTNSNTPQKTAPVAQRSEFQPEKQQTPAEDLKQSIDQFIGLVQSQGAEAALAELQNKSQTDPVVFKNCHAIAHAIGHAGFIKYGSFTEALKHQSSACSDGYLHGVIEQAFVNTPDVFAAMKTICNGLTYEAGRCYHGVGHGLMYYTSNDLPKSLALCNQYSFAAARSRCNEGVFMENFLSDGKIHPSEYVNASNPAAPCGAQQARYKAYCYFYVPIYYLDNNMKNNDYDYAGALKWCNTVEQGYVYTCYRGVGSLAMKYDMNSPKFVENVCMGSPNKSLLNGCLDGMVSYYLTFHGRLSSAYQMCATMQQQNLGACDLAVNRRAGEFVD